MFNRIRTRSVWVALVALGSACVEAGPPPAAVTVTARVPADAPTVYLTGSLPELGPWDPSGLAMDGEGSVRTATVRVPVGELFEFKLTLGSWDREGLGPSGTVRPNFRVTPAADTTVTVTVAGFKEPPSVYMADPEGGGVLGRLVYWQNVPSRLLAEERHVGIWLPPGYDDDTERRYPVIYMHDGQNLFDPRIANTGIDWGVDEAMVAGVASGRHGPAIVVGIWNTSRRLTEYSPWHEGPDYADFLVSELIPRVNREFRTLEGPGSTFTMGSSLGGLISFHLVKEHPDVFGACGCVSTHLPFSEDVMATIRGDDDPAPDDTPYVIRDLEGGEPAPDDGRFFFDWGTDGLDAAYGPVHQRVRDWFQDAGLDAGEDFLFREYPGADHDEASWRARVGDQLEWLLAGTVPPPPPA